jgi:hypothetical protein
MKFYTTTMAALAIAMATTGMAQAATVDIVQAGTPQTGPNYFTPTDADKDKSPYYRNGPLDWGWAHNAIAGPITTASLLISAYDVDFSFSGFTGERDMISAFDAATATWVNLGFLAGGNDIWAYTTFNLTANLLDDVATGLQVRIDIDSTFEGWYVALSKSVLTTDFAAAPPPEPGVSAVPLPAGAWLLLAGLGGLAALRRRKKA